MDNSNIFSQAEIEKNIKEFGKIAVKKYAPSNNTLFSFHDRKWPSQKITSAPKWVSVDLRDGNQALLKPMNIKEKIELFILLVNVGFKEIEIGFPSASDTEFAFTRHLIENNLIPEDVTIQVLCQAREHLIKRTAESLEGAKNITVHIYNSTSVNQRKIVFKKSKQEIIDIAVSGVMWVKQYFSDFPGKLQFEYSPESFTGTELMFAKEICDSVVKAWNPQGIEKVILNIPATVENCSANVFADTIEWMHENLSYRDHIILSLHNHNDRGTAIAATELGLLAGAERVEGTLLGNGERTGNTDIVNLALNLFTQGISPELDLSHLDNIKNIIENITQISTYARHPYIGEFVHTAFSGSHQDAIKKGLDWQSQNSSHTWNVPYLPIDPNDIGQGYREIIQINSQSGKGGIAYILEGFGYKNIPKNIQQNISSMVQKKADTQGRKIENKEILEIFETHFVNMTGNIKSNNFNESKYDGDGIIDKLSHFLKKENTIDFDILNYEQYSMNKGSDSLAITYFLIVYNGKEYWGVGNDEDVTCSAQKGLISVLNTFL